MSLIIMLLVGALAGWLAGQIMKGRGFGALGKIVVGIVGAVIGGSASSFFGFSLGGGLIGSTLTATGGAVILLAVIGVLKKA